jgi:hypothetical protein
LSTPQGEAKGLDTIGKKSTTKIQAKKMSQMYECKLSLNKCISPNFSSLDANSPWKHELGTFLPFVGNA